MKNQGKKKQAKKIKTYVAKLNELRKFQFITFAIIIITLLLMLVSFGYIHNTDMNDGAGGTEVSYNGYNLLFAAFSGNYKTMGGAFGDLAVPFHYYAEAWVRTMAILIFFPFFALFINFGLNIYILIKNKQSLSLYSIILNGISFIYFLAIFIIALTMRQSDILPIYCSGNKACSIHSLAILPALSIGLGIVIGVLNYLGYKKAKKELNE